MAISSEVLLVVTPDPTSIIDAYALLKTLDKREDFNSKETTIKMISNRVEGTMQGKVLFQKLNTVVNEFLKLKLEYLGPVPQDNYLSRGVMAQNPVSLSYPNSPSCLAIAELARIIDKQDASIVQERKGISGFFFKLAHRLGR